MKGPIVRYSAIENIEAMFKVEAKRPQIVFRV
jgi:hypothetical protein